MGGHLHPACRLLRLSQQIERNVTRKPSSPTATISPVRLSGILETGWAARILAAPKVQIKRLFLISTA
jgi:hypothetical protein